MHAVDWSGDQAAGLRRIVSPQPVQAIAIASGKGGVGKTNVSVNLAIALAARGRGVMLLDGDVGLGNADVLLGLHATRNLSHVLDGECSLEDVVVPGPAGLHVVPAASGLRRMLNLGPTEHAALIRAFSEIGIPLDTLVVDTAAGASDGVLGLAGACNEVVVVVCDEPASITDAYALIKVMSRHGDRNRFRILANMTRGADDGRRLYMKLVRATDRFLSVSLDYMGCVPYDDFVLKAVQRQRAVVDAYPRSRAASAFKKLAEATDKWPVPNVASGRLEFFVERLVQAGLRPVEAQL